MLFANPTEILEDRKIKRPMINESDGNTRLSRLYDAKFDREITEEAFRLKEAEYKTQAIEIKAQVEGAK